jgi:predicted outer membrane repeat protein
MARWAPAFFNRNQTTSKPHGRPRLRPVLEILESRIAPATTRFAMIGDYGAGSTAEQKVATRVNSWSPDFVVTVGDNNYGTPNYDAHVGQYYHNYIYPYTGSYGAGASTNRFWPAVGNEDYDNTLGLAPYLKFFTLPGNERYYDVTIGPVEFFMLNGDSREPDGNSATSAQATWLRNELAASTATWKLVITHFPPYSTAQWAVSTAARWPYQQWGATAVFSGHSHTYERLLEDNNFPYFVDGLGGDSRDSFTNPPAAGSQVRFTGDYGAMLIQADTSQINFQFVGAWNYPGQVFDTYTITASTTTGLTAPSNLTATAAGTGQVNLGWADQSSSETGFKIERSTDGNIFTQIATVAANVMTYSDAGLTPGTHYWYRVRATSSTGDSAYSNQASEIARGAATHLQISAPSADPAGQAFSFTLTALDSIGNTAVGYTGTVHFTSGDGQAVLPGDYTYVSGDGGVRTFSATLMTSGSQSLTATDTASSSITGSQTGIAVSSASTSGGGTSILTVNTTADNTIADNFLTLREAIQVVSGTLGRALTAGEQAQLRGTLGNNDTIQFAVPSGPQTITLTSGALSILRPIAITGPGPTLLTVSGNNSDRVFVVGQIWSPNPSLVVSMSGLTIAGGSATTASNNYGGGLLNFGTLTVSNTVFSANAAGSSGGGGMYNVGSLTLNNDTFTGNSVTSGGAGAGVNNIGSGTLQVNGCIFSGNSAVAGGSGAGIANSGHAAVTGSTFTGGSAASNGGAIFNSVEGTLTVGGSAFTSNSAASDGGAIDNDGTLTVTASLFASNTSASEGGGIDSSGTIVGVSNSTFSGNVAGSRGGGISSTGAVQITSSTLTGNRAVSGSSGAFGGGLFDGLPAKLFNTIVAGNFQGPTSNTTASDVYGSLDATSAFNLIGTGGAGGLTGGSNGNQVGVANPGLGALANNGGPTQTIALLPGSPAIDHGSNTYVASGVADQRGLPRIANGTVDIGAFEVQPAVTIPSSLVVTGFPSATTAGAAATFTVMVRDASGNTVTGYLGTLHFSSSDGQASLPADYTFTSSDNGVHTFSATLKAAGTQSLTVKDTATSNLTATQSGITVQPGAASQLVISGPSSINAGKTFTLTVVAMDAYGNVATSYAGTLHFTSSDSSGSMPSDYAFTMNDQGQHSFSGVKLRKKGTQTITITDTLNPSLTAKVTVKVT